MSFPVTIPNTFANATSSIPLSQLDNNFTTLVTALNGVANGAESLANVTITGGNISNVTLDNVTVDVETLSNVTITNLTVDGTANLTNSTVTANLATITTANVTTLNVSGVSALAPGAIISGSSSGDALRITQTGSGNALVVEDSANPDSTPFVVDASGNLILGYGTAQSIAGVTPSIQQLGSGSYSNTWSGKYAPNATANNYYFSKSRSSVVGSFATVNSGDALGNIYFYGDDGSSFVASALITAAVDGTPGTNDMPGRLVFSTTADGASSPSERMRIDSSGNVLLGQTAAVSYNGYAVSIDGGQQISGTTGGTAALSINRYGNAANGAQIVLAHSRGASVGTNTIVASGDPLGIINFNGANGTGYDIAAQIRGEVDGTPGASADMPGRLTFYTTPDGSATSTERMRITSSGGVNIGGTTTINDAVGSLQLTGTGSGSTSGGGILNFFRPATDGVVNGSNLGSILFFGADTTGNTPTQLAFIRGQASGTHAAGDNPTDIVFGTTPDGSATVAEVARFTQDKYLRLASGTGGIQFGGDTDAANALDDYEEGTWTPVISDANFGGNVSPTAATSAIYTKVGRMVTVQCFFTNVDTTGMTAGNNYTIQGFPFTAASVTGTVIIPGSIIVQNITFSGYLTPALFDNTTYARIAKNVTGNTASYVLVSETSSGVTDFYLNMTYQSA